MPNYNVYITADLHIRHKNILHHQKNRIKGMNLLNDADVEGHDKYVIDMWKNITKRGDHIYVVGDFIMSNQQDSLKILHELKSNGCHIHLIVGNHDKSTHKMYNMFESISDIKRVIFKKDVFDFLQNDFTVIMCHYPMISWQDKPRGSMMLYGHVHLNAPIIDTYPDLRMNVGIDNPLCNYKLFSLEQIYNYYLNKLGGLSIKEYLIKMDNEYKDTFVR